MAEIKIHRVIEGPFDIEDGVWYNLCLVEDETGCLLHKEVLYPSMDLAYEDIKTLSKQIDPIIVEAVDV